MSLPDWPATLPQYWLADRYSRSNRNRSNVTEMDDGRVVKRRRTTRVARREVFSAKMNAAQFAAFEEFFYTTLNEGVSRFTMPTPNADGSYTSRTVQIEGDEPETTSEGDWWLVSFPVTVYP